MGKAQSDLSSEAQKEMRRIAKDYELSADARLVLTVAFQNWDMARQARAILRQEGLLKAGRRHPCVEIVKQADALFLRSLRELGLNLDEPGDPGRPPAEA